MSAAPQIPEPAPEGDRRAKARLTIAILSVLAALAAVGSIVVGPSDLRVSEIPSLLAQLVAGPPAEPSVDYLIFFHIRLPRTALGVGVGAALAVAGAMMQSLFRNPLADPGLVGVSSGAALGAVTAIVLGASTFGAAVGWLGLALLPAFAFTGGLISTLVLYGVSTRRGMTSTATMLLAGIGIGALTGAVVSFLIYMADDAQLRDVTFWLMGGLGGATWRQVAVAMPLILSVLIVTPFIARGLDALVLGEMQARHLGVSVQVLKRLIILMVALAVGAAVAVSGIVGFIGIVVPHMLRLAIGPEHRTLLPACALLGASLTLCADMVCRTVVAPAELPLGIITAMLGAPFFLFLLLRKRGLLEV